jgi:hypothetical protein
MRTMEQHIVRAACVAAFVLTMFTNSVTHAAGDEAPADPNQAVIERLEQTIVDATYEKVDFDRIIENIRETYELNIHVSWKMLEEAGVRRDERIEIRLRQVPLATVLDMVLREVSDELHRVGYQVADGIIVISTEEDLGRNTILRAYDISDLIESGYAIRRFSSTPVLSMHVTGREFIGSEQRRSAEKAKVQQAGGGSIFDEPDEDPAQLGTMERIEQIVDLITLNVDPESWDVHGGSIGSIHAIDNVLLIRHTMSGHRKIRTFLDLVRSNRATPLHTDAAIIRLRVDEAAELRAKFADDFPRVPASYVDQLMTGTDLTGLMFRATDSGASGQRDWFSALTQHELLTGLVPTVGHGINAFQPRVGFTTQGLELIAFPLVLPGGEELILDVQMAWIPAATVSERPVRLASGEAEASIDRVTQRMRTVSTNVKLDFDEGVALTIPAELGEAGPAIGYEDWLVLRVRRAEH